MAPALATIRACSSVRFLRLVPLTLARKLSMIAPHDSASMPRTTPSSAHCAHSACSSAAFLRAHSVSPTASCSGGTCNARGSGRQQAVTSAAVDGGRTGRHLGKRPTGARVRAAPLPAPAGSPHGGRAPAAARRIRACRCARPRHK
eukprot:7378354-Prymnesium_polylepis.1